MLYPISYYYYAALVILPALIDAVALAKKKKWVGLYLGFCVIFILLHAYTIYIIRMYKLAEAMIFVALFDGAIVLIIASFYVGLSALFKYQLDRRATYQSVSEKLIYLRPLLVCMINACSLLCILWFSFSNNLFFIGFIFLFAIPSLILYIPFVFWPVFILINIIFWQKKRNAGKPVKPSNVFAGDFGPRSENYLER